MCNFPEQKDENFKEDKNKTITGLNHRSLAFKLESNIKLVNLQ